MSNENLNPNQPLDTVQLLTSDGSAPAPQAPAAPAYGAPYAPQPGAYAAPGYQQPYAPAPAYRGPAAPAAPAAPQEKNKVGVASLIFSILLLVLTSLYLTQYFLKHYDDWMKSSGSKAETIGQLIAIILLGAAGVLMLLGSILGSRRGSVPMGIASMLCVGAASILVYALLATYLNHVSDFEKSGKGMYDSVEEIAYRDLSGAFPEYLFLLLGALLAGIGFFAKARQLKTAGAGIMLGISACSLFNAITWMGYALDRYERGGFRYYSGKTELWLANVGLAAIPLLIAVIMLAFPLRKRQKPAA